MIVIAEGGRVTVEVLDAFVRLNADEARDAADRLLVAADIAEGVSPKDAANDPLAAAEMAAWA